MLNTSLHKSRPKVSVLMITYNHEKYIEQAVRSVLMQETDFEYELVIGEDCSTDRTHEIVIALQKEFPDKIRLFLHPQNVGMIPNLVAVYGACEGEYIALLEGDDYWTSPHKLQLQVNYMEAHPDCRISFHATEVVFQDEPDRPSKLELPPNPEAVNFVTWLSHLTHRPVFMHTNSIVIRAIDKSLPSWFMELQFAADWPLVVWTMLHGGEMAFIEADKPMSVYRKHTGGVTHNYLTRGSEKRVGLLLKNLNDHLMVGQLLDPYLRQCLRPGVFLLNVELIREYLNLGARDAARRHFFQALSCTTWSSKKNLRTLASLAMQLYLSKIYAWIKLKNNLRPLQRIDKSKQ